MSTPTISPATTMGAVQLTVSDLARSLGFWQRTVGLEALERAESRATLGAGGRELVVLVEEPGARPAHGHTGLFHLALLLPTRTDLACWLAHAARERVPLQGASDHYVSEALYLGDPDGHGIEIYADRPREVWQGQVDVRMTSLPLDADDVLSELEDPEQEPFGGLADGTAMGHVHLRVAGVSESIGFYRDVLGFELTARLGDQAAFLAAGGYHHHIGANTWQSAGAAPPREGTARLLYATIVLPDETARSDVLARLDRFEETPEGPLVRDPSGNGLVFAVAA
jgi:catechol 2,3-dioxygenase